VPNSTARRGARATKPRHKQPRQGDWPETHHREGGHAPRATRHNGTDRADNRFDRTGDRTNPRFDRADSRHNGDRAGYRDDRPGTARDDRQSTYRDDRQGGYRDDRRGGYRGHTADTRRGYRDEAPARGRGADRGNSRRDTTNWSAGGQHTDRNRFGNRRDERPAAYGRGDSGRGQGDFRERSNRPYRADRRPADDRYPRNTEERRGGSDRPNQPYRAAEGKRGSDFRERPNRTHRPTDGTAIDRAGDVTTGARRNGDTANHWDGDITESGGKQSSVSFAELGLPTPLLRALEAQGITEPFPIQSATLPDALGGRDVLGRAQTGSGKTLAFGLALLTRLHKGKPRPGRPRGLVLVPTRELAMQVTEALMPLAKSLGLWCRTVVGGMSFGKQTEQLERGIDLLIATPGRLSDHVRQGTCVLDDVRFVTLDEADQMADMGFLPQVRAILDLVPAGQRMLFSATLDRDVAALVDNYLTDPVTHSVSPATATVSTMDHHLLLVSREDKPAVVAEMAARDGRTIMFLRTKHHVDRLTRQLREVGVRAGALHGGKPQGARNRVLGDFKDGRLPVLIATDVAARGIHVDGISLVVHVDPPGDAKGYLHRAGRTARAGEAGTVVTVVTHQERRTVFRMTEQAGVQPERTKVRPGDDDLARITGARTPSGDPLADEPAPRPAGRFNRPPRRRAPRPGR
jgi:superfamily II DNA/RNA helicase